jgi:hypothetical protein
MKLGIDDVQRMNLELILSRNFPPILTQNSLSLNSEKNEFFR